jgi:hypothetical protein
MLNSHLRDHYGAVLGHKDLVQIDHAESAIGKEASFIENVNVSVRSRSQFSIVQSVVQYDKVTRCVARNPKPLFQFAKPAIDGSRRLGAPLAAASRAATRASISSISIALAAWFKVRGPPSADFLELVSFCNVIPNIASNNQIVRKEAGVHLRDTGKILSVYDPKGKQFNECSTYAINDYACRVVDRFTSGPQRTSAR